MTNDQVGGPLEGVPQGSPAQKLADHLAVCRGVDAALVADGNVDDLVARMIADGWRYTGVEYVEGKRVRYLKPPPGRGWINDQVGGPFQGSPQSPGEPL